MAKINPKTVFIIALAIVVVWLLYENAKKDDKIEELQKEIDENENLTNEVKERLSELIKNNKEVNPRIANELGQIAALIEIKQDNVAVLKLAKIIENLLKELYKGDKELKEIATKNNRSRVAFADYLELARNRNVITSEDYHLLSVMVIIRNAEAHELDVQKEKSRILAAIISGIGIILGLCKILKRKSIEEVLD